MRFCLKTDRQTRDESAFQGTACVKPEEALAAVSREL